MNYHVFVRFGVNCMNIFFSETRKTKESNEKNNQKEEESCEGKG